MQCAVATVTAMFDIANDDVLRIVSGGIGAKPRIGIFVAFLARAGLARNGHRKVGEVRSLRRALLVDNAIQSALNQIDVILRVDLDLAPDLLT